MKIMKHFTLLAVFLTLGFASFSQAECGTPGWFCMENGTFIVSDGNTASDNNGGGAYIDTPSNITMTLCPDTPGDVVQLTFSAFALQTSPNANNSDYLAVYDGDDTSAPSLGSYTGSSIQGLQITGTVFNTSGCLTLVFSDNSLPNATSPGFEAQIQCTTPCANPTSGSQIISPAPEDPAIQTVSLCMNADVTFGSAGSFAEPGFSIANYIWNFDDGTILVNTNGNNVTHAFSEPGEYVVTLTIEDNNFGDDPLGCMSLNIIPLQVLVSTYPTFSGMTDLETCLGETVFGDVVVGDPDAIPGSDTEIGGGASGTTWTALPPQVVAGETYLADGAGFAYSTSLVFDFFEAGATLDDCSFLTNIFVNMEHSYMGDLGLFITCPDGTLVNLVEWGTNGGGGTFLGEAIDDNGTTPGVGYDYYWTPEATNGVWGENLPGGFGGSLASGTYEAAGDLCDLVGCPLNGEWSFTVTDNLAIDNGYIFAWGISFDPSLYPGVTSFTPQIGAGPDSSYWVVTGPGTGIPWIVDQTADGDQIEITPEAVGVYDYTYVVLNDFGCQFDTTIQLTVTQAPLISAGPDQLFSCGTVQLDGSLIGEPTVPCADAGMYDYCYSNGVFYQQTYCPDVPGSGLITISFLSGSTDGVNDYLYVYDGPDTWPSPYIGGYTGDLSGLTWTSTSASGCLTFYISEWDGANDCADGSTIPWNYSVTCGSAVAAGYVWDWNPGTGLDFNNIQDPTVMDLSQTTTYQLTGYPAGHPACGSTDEAVVSVDPLGDPGLDTDITICSTDPAFDMLSELDGSPVLTGVWLDPNNVALPDGNFDPMTDLPGNYTYSVAYGNCEAHAILFIDMALPTIITVPNDTVICELGSVNLDLYGLNNGQPDFTYSWAYDADIVSSISNDVFTPLNSGVACLTVLDACGYSVTDCFNVAMLPAVNVIFTADTTKECWPHTYQLANEVDPTLFTSSEWEVSDGTFYQNSANQSLNFLYPGTYNVKLTVTNALGCSYSAMDTLYAFAPPVAGYTLTPQPTNIMETEISFSDASDGNIAAWAWTFGDNLGVSGAANPVFKFPNDKGETYPVVLRVTDVNNCVDYITGEVVINDILSFFIPNTFTPNNDGVNDVLFIKGADINPDRFSFMVFNRYGEKVFETADPTIPWVGDVHNGEYFAPNGTYNWRAIIVSKSTGEREELTGYINIIR